MDLERKFITKKIGNHRRILSTHKESMFRIPTTFTNTYTCTSV